eukprot:6490664-Amphidinium_carterae.2
MADFDPDLFFSATTYLGDDTPAPSTRLRLVGKQGVPDAARGGYLPRAKAAAAQERPCRQGRSPDRDSTKSKAQAAAASARSKAKASASRREQGAGTCGAPHEGSQSTRSKRNASEDGRAKHGPLPQPQSAKAAAVSRREQGAGSCRPLPQPELKQRRSRRERGINSITQ